jgi:hypothetical protein
VQFRLMDVAASILACWIFGGYRIHNLCEGQNDMGSAI